MVVLLGNYDVTDFSYPHSPIIFFTFAEITKELKTKRRKTSIFLNSIFIFGIYDYFWMGERFPGLV